MVATIAALMVCSRFSAWSNTMDAGDSVEKLLGAEVDLLEQAAPPQIHAMLLACE